jgi:hypothetical protein
MDGHRLGQPERSRQTELRRDGTLVTTVYDRRGRVVKRVFYRSSDEKLLLRVLASLQVEG